MQVVHVGRRRRRLLRARRRALGARDHCAGQSQQQRVARLAAGADADCSFNGRCAASLCACEPAWTGDRCQTLRLLPAAREGGARWREGGKNVSTWGGSVHLDGGTFHMWLSELVNHCGITSCVHNSHIVHATAPTADGPCLHRIFYAAAAPGHLLLPSLGPVLSLGTRGVRWCSG